MIVLKNHDGSKASILNLTFLIDVKYYYDNELTSKQFERSLKFLKASLPKRDLGLWMYVEFFLNDNQRNF